MPWPKKFSNLSGMISAPGISAAPPMQAIPAQTPMAAPMAGPPIQKQPMPGMGIPKPSFGEEMDAKKRALGNIASGHRGF